MRKALFAAALIAAVAALALVSGRVASADNGATHTVGTSPCGLLDSNGSCVVTPYRSISNHGGVEVEKTWADGVFNNTGKAVHWSYENTGFTCTSDASGAVTTDWKETLSASGHADLTCQFRS